MHVIGTLMVKAFRWNGISNYLQLVSFAFLEMSCPFPITTVYIAMEWNNIDNVVGFDINGKYKQNTNDFIILFYFIKKKTLYKVKYKSSLATFIEISENFIMHQSIYIKVTYLGTMSLKWTKWLLKNLPMHQVISPKLITGLSLKWKKWLL